jgi:hypothetical protein
MLMPVTALFPAMVMIEQVHGAMGDRCRRKTVVAVAVFHGSNPDRIQTLLNAVIIELQATGRPVTSWPTTFRIGSARYPGRVVWVTPFEVRPAVTT